MGLDIGAFNQLIKDRRSVYPKMYSGEKVPKKVIDQMLENANWAPTHRLTEPWRFRVFTEGGLKTLADFQSALYKRIAEKEGNFSEATFLKLRDKPIMCSHIISIGMKRDNNDRLPEIEEVSAVACAVQNMYLTATAHGVGCYWGSGGVTYREEAKPFFGLDAKDKLLGFLFIGMPKGQWPKSNRSPIAQKVTWVIH